MRNSIPPGPGPARLAGTSRSLENGNVAKHPDDQRAAPSTPISPQLEGLGGAPSRRPSLPVDSLTPSSSTGETVVSVPSPDPATPPPLSTKAKVIAIASTVGTQMAVSGVSWGIANKVSAAVITAGATAGIKDLLIWNGYPEEQAELSAKVYGQIVGTVAGNVIAIPLTGWAHRQLEAFLIRWRQSVEGDGQDMLHGIGFAPGGEYHNKREATQAIFIGVFGAAGGLKSLIKSYLPKMTPVAGFFANQALDVGSSSFAGGLAQGTNIAWNAHKTEMTFEKVKVPVPSDSRNPNVTHPFDGETRNRMEAVARATPTVMLADIASALLTTAAASSTNTAALRERGDLVTPTVSGLLTTEPSPGIDMAAQQEQFNRWGGVALGALKSMALLAHFFHGKNIAQGVRPSGRREREGAEALEASSAASQETASSAVTDNEESVDAGTQTQTAPARDAGTQTQGERRRFVRTPADPRADVEPPTVVYTTTLNLTGNPRT